MNESGGMISRRLGQEMAMITNRPPQAEEILGRTNEQSKFKFYLNIKWQDDTR